MKLTTLRKILILASVFLLVTFFQLKTTRAQSQYIDFQNAIYYTASGNVLTSSGQSLSSFDYSTASPSHPLLTAGVYFQVVDYLGNNLWIRVRHITADPNGINVGYSVTATASSPFRLGGFGGWWGFLYQFDIYSDINITGLWGNTLNGEFNTSVLVESIETLSSGEWLSLVDSRYPSVQVHIA